MDLNKAPEIDEIDETDICDSSDNKHCFEPSLLGRHFIDMNTLLCKIKISKVIDTILSKKWSSFFQTG